MTAMYDTHSAALSQLIAAADDFAQRALDQEIRRDRSRPGTGAQQRHAHSATLWRAAESALRARLVELDPHTANASHVGRLTL